LRLKPALVLVDGNRLPLLTMRAEAIVKGDALVAARELLPDGWMV
jgi:ribonuclease HII